MTSNIYFQNTQQKEKVDKQLRDLVRDCCHGTLEYENIPLCLEISVTFTDDEGIQILNRKTRNKDCATDVLSFPMLSAHELANIDSLPYGQNTLGDIVISLQRARKQSQEYGHSFEREVGFLTVHSMLHLLGYDHEESKIEEEKMFELQEAILKNIGLGRGEKND